ncbi:unnamed protein product [Trifolium pratense]|uniref:Uncharacterized protein n=2 Tax=Trifolium pratense TaxID=57577 RepID=A0ACB0J0N2_TRIPR|nr:unnamed protein product [Trifolium pratense]CAJ2637685.1 unnamed protein product [Trifolium pratense]
MKDESGERGRRGRSKSVQMIKKQLPLRCSIYSSFSFRTKVTKFYTNTLSKILSTQRSNERNSEEKCMFCEPSLFVIAFHSMQFTFQQFSLV